MRWSCANQGRARNVHVRLTQDPDRGDNRDRFVLSKDFTTLFRRQWPFLRDVFEVVKKSVPGGRFLSKVDFEPIPCDWFRASSSFEAVVRDVDNLKWRLRRDKLFWGTVGSYDA